MKKPVRIMLFSLPFFMFNAYASDNCSCDTFDHTFFWVRPQYEVGSPLFIAGTRQQHWQTDDSCIGGAFQVTLFGGRSTNRKNLGKYFMPFCSNEAQINGNIENSENAILPQHFNIYGVRFTNFTADFLGLEENLAEGYMSKININPEQSIIGLGLSYYQQFEAWCRRYWFMISAPIMHVRNDMNLQETDRQENLYTISPVAGLETNLNDPQTSMISALQQNGWNFGKIDNKTHKKTKLGFIQIHGGPSFCLEGCYELKPFFGITIPTGNTPKGRQVFEPIAGNGNHFGFLWGAKGEFFLCESFCKNYELTLGLNWTMQYLLSKTQKRALNLKNKPWSRYIETYANLQQAQTVLNLPTASQNQILQRIFINTPGINLLTQDLKVKPGFNVSFNIAFILSQQCDTGFNFEGGYNFYAKQGECLSLKNRPFNPDGVAIKDHIGGGVINPIRNMSQSNIVNEANYMNLFLNTPFLPANIIADYPNGIIREGDLDFASAAHPCILTHTVYANLGYNWDWCIPFMASVGAAYEFSSRTNTGLNRWFVWGKAGFSF